MAFPLGWPPRQSPSYRSLRFFQIGTSTAAFSDRAYLFGTDPTTGAATQAGNVSPSPVVPPGSTSTTTLGNLPTGGASPVPAHDGAVPEGVIVSMRYANSIRVVNTASDATHEIEISFDGTNVHGVLKGGDDVTYLARYEAGIAVRTKGANHCVFQIEAW